MKTLRKGLTNIAAFVLTIILAIPTVHAQTVMPNVRVNTNDYYRVSLDGGAKSMAVVNEMVYAAWQGEPTDSTSNIYFSKSTDGGASFLLETLVYDGPTSTLHFFPSLYVAQNGNIYVAWTAASDNETNWNIWFSKSIDGGSTFQAPVHITTDNSSVYSCVGAYGDNVYVFYADATNYPMADYYFARSTNNGDSFGNAIQINDAVSASDIEFDAVNTLTIDQSGNIYLAWVDGRRANGNGDIFLARSTDDGQSFGTNVMVNDVNELGADSIQYNPSITVDNSNNVYVSFTDRRLGSDFEDSRVYVTKSSDGGSSFVTESLLAGHDHGCKSHDLSANASGKLSAALCAHVTPSWGTWLFESTDGGSNFSTPVALSDVFDADYSDIRISLNPNNEVSAIWKDDRTGTNNIYFTRTDLAIGVSDLAIESEYALYPNPSNSTLHIPSGVALHSIEVFNALGQDVTKQVAVNGSILEIGDLTAGIYFLRLNNSDHSRILKFVKQ